MIFVSIKYEPRAEHVTSWSKYKSWGIGWKLGVSDENVSKDVKNKIASL